LKQKQESSSNNLGEKSAKIHGIMGVEILGYAAGGWVG